MGNRIPAKKGADDSDLNRLWRTAIDTIDSHSNINQKTVTARMADHNALSQPSASSFQTAVVHRPWTGLNKPSHMI